MSTKLWECELKDVPDKQLHELARTTETSERFEDMCKIMNILVLRKSKENKALNVDERNMLSVAYKNVVGQRRSAWRILKSEDEFLGSRDDLKNAYRVVVEKELQQKCKEVLELFEQHLVKKEDAVNTEDSESVETQVFYLKMCGDYYRYLAEFAEEPAKEKTDDKEKTEETTETENKDKSKKSDSDMAIDRYVAAMDLAKESLKPTHPTRLGLALNASVCYYEICKEPAKACDLAKKAFDEAIQKLDSLSDSTYKDSTLIMQLLRDNLTIWTGDETNKEVEEQDD